MSSNFPSDYNVSLFTEIHTTVIAFRVHGLLNAPVDWSTAQYSPNYLDMVKVRYRTFYIECFKSQVSVINSKSLLGSEDRYYMDLFGNGIYSDMCVRLSRSQFGEDQYPIPGEQIRYPYRHDDLDFTHIFVVTLTESDIHSGYLMLWKMLNHASIIFYFFNFSLSLNSTMEYAVKVVVLSGSFVALSRKSWFLLGPGNMYFHFSS
ncbi:hypothetical protein TSUD_240570 [Trifolium subterraneum]|uniref:Uncharacterized protein n=1 Tax=Trifolium subterraneum TaxID=3900 RepID=A0A2Z6P1Z5_TRISU|nr:hypothetical protein TSUD_240570 [Trifolium subterraneum]